MIRKAVLFITALFVFALAWNCRKKPQDATFIAKGIEVTNMELRTNGWEEITDVDHAYAYELWTKLTGDVLYSKNSAKPSLFFAAAFAYDPAPPKFNDMVQSVKITSLSDFDSTHLAGTNLIDLFETAGHTLMDSSGHYPDLYANDSRECNFGLKHGPLADSVQQFIIEVKFQNSGTFTDTAAAVTFRR